MDTTTHSYRDTSGITNRANSAMLRIEQIIGDTRIPSMARLALVAEVMAGGLSSLMGARPLMLHGMRQSCGVHAVWLLEPVPLTRSSVRHFACHSGACGSRPAQHNEKP